MPTRAPTAKPPGLDDAPDDLVTGNEGELRSGSSPSTTWRSVRQTPPGVHGDHDLPQAGLGRRQLGLRRGVPGESSTIALALSN